MGLFKKIGNLLNDVTGASSAAETNYKTSIEQAKNAHQWEVEDLKKAGLNPVLSAGGSSASSIAGSGNVGAKAGGTGAISDVTNSAMSILQGLQETKRLQSDLEGADADTRLREQQIVGTGLDNIEKELRNKNLPAKYKADLLESKARYQNILTNSARVNQENMKNEFDALYASKRGKQAMATDKELNGYIDKYAPKAFRNTAKSIKDAIIGWGK